jgi:hypothetical protein
MKVRHMKILKKSGQIIPPRRTFSLTRMSIN